MASAASFLIRQFLDWVARCPRSRTDLREAWSSTCPLTCAWEDALADDLVGYGPGGTLVLTARGAALVGVCPAATPAAVAPLVPSLDRRRSESMVPRAMYSAARQSARSRPARPEPAGLKPSRPSRGDRL